MQSLGKSWADEINKANQIKNRNSNAAGTTHAGLRQSTQ
jgi:hypothetical protein